MSSDHVTNTTANVHRGRNGNGAATDSKNSCGHTEWENREKTQLLQPSSLNNTTEFKVLTWDPNPIDLNLIENPSDGTATKRHLKTSHVVCLNNWDPFCWVTYFQYLNIDQRYAWQHIWNKNKREEKTKHIKPRRSNVIAWGKMQTFFWAKSG